MLHHTMLRALLVTLAPLQVAALLASPIRSTTLNAARRSSACTIVMDAADDAAKLAKLRATLTGLRDDGIPAEALAPLETEIAALEATLAPPADPRLEKLRATLAGLRADGIPDEALAPLEAEIAELEASMPGDGAAAAAPPAAAPAAPPPPELNITQQKTAAELAKAQATLNGLLADGFPLEELTGLQSQIADLEAKANAEASLPPFSAEQQRIYELCDAIDKEGTRSDEDAPKRAKVLRQERLFLLKQLLKADTPGYAAV